MQPCCMYDVTELDSVYWNVHSILFCDISCNLLHARVAVFDFHANILHENAIYFMLHATIACNKVASYMMGFMHTYISYHTTRPTFSHMT